MVTVYCQSLMDKKLLFCGAFDQGKRGRGLYNLGYSLNERLLLLLMVIGLGKLIELIQLDRFQQGLCLYLYSDGWVFWNFQVSSRSGISYFFSWWVFDFNFLGGRVTGNFHHSIVSKLHIFAFSTHSFCLSSGLGTYKHVSGIGWVGTIKITPSGQAGRGFLLPDPSLLFDTNNVSVSRH